jgi:hypothetical protein
MTGRHGKDDGDSMRLGRTGGSFFSILVMLAVCAAAHAGPTYEFACITNTSAVNAATGNAQLFVEVNNPGSGQVSFLFTNTGPLPCSICDVYFDDGSLLGIASINEGPGVAFDTPATPANLPGGNSISPPFETTAGFSVDSDEPVQSNGVNPGEFLEILFDLQAGKVYADVLSDLGSGELRIGLHVQAFADGNSESFVNIPAPGAFLLATLGIGCIRWFRMRKVLGI